jgi:histidine ammonia-lyase
MTTVASFALEEARRLLVAADAACALSLDAIRGTVQAFDPRIQDVRGQAGQKVVARNIRRLFEGKDTIAESHKDCGKVQDPYSFRCAPQVHGATRDTLAFVAQTVETELNAVTDNPLVFDDGAVVSGGNFHGQPIALAMDFLAIAVAELGSISERRIEKITNPALSGLPAFATRNSGLNSGFMIPHVVAAALVSENKVLCHPASVDSIPTSADKEDHVSMGPIAARKAREVVRNVRRVLAIEYLAACQGVDLLAPLRPAPALDAIYEAIRRMAAPVNQDRSMAGEIEAVADWIDRSGVQATLAAAGVPMDTDNHPPSGRA